MDHNLDDSLNLESAIGVDFHSEDIEVGQADIALHTSGHDGDIPMEFEHIEEQPMLMDSGNEEIIEFMGSDQFTLQEYSIHDDQLSGAHTVVETSSGSLASNMAYDAANPNIIHVQAAPPHQLKKILSQKPRPIAPRPPKLAPLQKTLAGAGPPGKLYAIAPKPANKPVALVANKSMLGKKISLAGLSKPNNSVLAQIGKQLVMLPGSGGQKIKLVSSQGTKTLQTQIGSSLPGAQTKVAKVVMQVSQASTNTTDEPAVLSRVAPVSTGNAKTHYVMHQKHIPVCKDMFLVGSPSKKTVKIAKQPQYLTIVKSPNAAGGTTTKKVVISAKPPQNLILKTTAPPKTATINQDGTITNAPAQKSELHQINVPGKGIQYIRLITTPTSSVASLPSSKVKPITAKQSVLALPSKYLLPDTKPSVGNIVQMSAENQLEANKPPPLVLTGTPAKINKVTSKPMQKLVRIAPMNKPLIPVSSQGSARAAQSLLAPRPADLAAPLVKQEPRQDDRHSSAEDSNSNSMEDPYEEIPVEEHPLIVVPNYKQEATRQDDSMDDPLRVNKMQISIEGEVLLSYPDDQNESNPEGRVDMSNRGRKACNCTKSQCLKLYCDCFANGEFCNRCNCNNCHNNLENEELRQKAIRGCLERNPNAFRPKIGKAKNAGPEMIRRHNKGCNCKRSGCLKNYCECFEAKIACTSMCKCVGCRNVEESLERRRGSARPQPAVANKQPCSFMTTEVIEAVCQCLLAASVESGGAGGGAAGAGGGAEGAGRAAEGAGRAAEGGARRVLTEFSRCLQDIISASHQPAPFILEEGHA